MIRTILFYPAVVLSLFVSLLALIRIKYLELRESLKKLEVNNYIREIKKIDLELSEITKQKTILAKELNEKEELREKMDKNVELANEEIEKLERIHRLYKRCNKSK